MSAPPTRAQREAEARSPAEQVAHERAAVAAHYEHDPAVFSLVLDARLAYAVGVFAREDEDLDAAQARKFARIAERLAIRPGDRVLDVGCGWGSNLLYLAEHTGGVFHGITLSEAQRAETLARARALGVADRVRVDRCHFEDLGAPPERYDAILFSGSIVHMHHRAEVHGAVARMLTPGGRLLLSDCYFPAQVRGDRGSAATHHIFVEALGYCRLLGLSEELGLVEQAGLDVLLVEDLTAHYVLTVDRWIDNIRRNRRRIEALAPGFARLLQSYMSVGRASFARRTALEYMILATKGPPSVGLGRRGAP